MRFHVVLLSAFILFLAGFPVAGGVEAPGIAWSKTYGGKFDEGALALVETSDGGFAIAGYTTSSGAGVYDDLYDDWLVRTDAFGNMLWNRTYGRAHDQAAKALVETSDGGFAFIDCGRLIRTDAYGNMLWSRGLHNAWALVETSDGGFALVLGLLTFGECFGLVRTDAYGNVLWNKTYASGGEGWALVETSDGGFAIAGHRVHPYRTDADCWLVKTDAYGNIVWNCTYGGAEDEVAWALVETSDGGFAIAGCQGNHFWLVRTDAYGNMLWNRTYGSGCARAIVETSDGGFAIAGTNFRVVRTDAYGNMLWNRTYGSGCARAIVETSDGGFAMAGFTSPIYSGSSDVLLVRTRPESRPPTVSIVSPENRTYTANSVPLTFTVNKPAKWMAYSLDGKANVTIDGNTTLNELPNGSHNITVYATDLEGNTAASKTIYFTVDAQGSFPTLLVTIASMISITGTATGLLYYKKRSTSRKLQKNT